MTHRPSAFDYLSDFTHLSDCSEPTNEPPSESPELLAPTTCRVATMIAAKNGAVITVNVVMTAGWKARGPGNFVNYDQIFFLKIITFV
jgi:hypothetical protein